MLVDVQGLVQAAVTRENWHFEGGADDSEGWEFHFVGQRNKGSKKKPTVPEILQRNFVIVEWDGR